MELGTIHKVAVWGFALAAIFGAIAYRTNFCTMGAISDWVNFGDKSRLRAWALGIGVAVLGTQGLVLAGIVDLGGAIYLTPNFSWLACLVGGLMFGVGMTLASGCGQRSLVRMGAGNLKSLVVVIVMGVTAYTTFRGLLAFGPRSIFWPIQVKLEELGIEDQSFVAVIGSVADLEDTALLRVVVALVVALALLGFALADGSFRRNFDNLLAGASVGLLVVAGWYVTGVVGLDDFEPMPVESMSFILPTGDTVSYVMTYTGATIKFGVAIVLGMMAGAFAYSVATRQFRFEGFTSLADTARHVVGALLMGFGGIVGFGCTIGQGVSGMSTLSMGSLLALSAIVLGAAITMKIQYHLLDDQGFGAALRRTLSDFRLLASQRASGT